MQERTFHPSRFFALPPKPKPSFKVTRSRLRRPRFFLLAIACPHIGDKRGSVAGGFGDHRSDINPCDMRRKGTLRMLTPRSHRPLRLGRFAPDETDKHVEAANREQEEGRSESERVDAVGQNSSADSVRKSDERLLRQDIQKKAYRHCMSPRAPTPKFLPKTGKNRSKNEDGQPNSERIRTIVCPMIRSRLRTAQNSPAG